MKKVLIIVFALFMLYIPGASHALIDFSVYGGYAFSGELKTPQVTTDLTGFSYGGRLLFTDSFLILDYGLGAFVQYAPLKYSIAGSKYNSEKANYGVDGYVGIWVIPFVEPYLRAGYSFYESIQLPNQDKTGKWFTSMYYGAGLGFKLPMPVFRLMVFAEYLRNKDLGEFDDGSKADSHTVNLGVSLGI